MARPSLIAALLVLVPRLGWSEPTQWLVAPAAQCTAAIMAAQTRFAGPAGLLDAIGRVESGRRDPLTGAIAPWPWTVDVEGEGHFYETEAEAITAVRRFQQQNRRSIDIGCMQVNLLQHPDAFPSLEAAFDPANNARYAAAYLTRLRAGAGDWLQAVGLYHSATPALAGPYRIKVEAALAGEASPQGGAPALPTVQSLAMAAPMTPFGSVAGAMRLGGAPPMPNRGQGRSLSYYRAMPVRPR